MPAADPLGRAQQWQANESSRADIGWWHDLAEYGVWIRDGEKYALVALKVKLEGAPPPRQIAPDLLALTATSFEVPSYWHELLGSRRARQVAKCNLFLVSKVRSETPSFLDAESKSLQRHAHHFYVGLMLSVPFSPSYKPAMLTGARLMA